MGYDGFLVFQYSEMGLENDDELDLDFNLSFLNFWLIELFCISD